MYICPLCKREFIDAEQVAKHNLKCWRERNPDHRSVPVPQGETIMTHQVNNDMGAFFASFRKDNNARGSC